MAQPWESYHQIIVETYSGGRIGLTSRVHVRPLPGQMYPPSMDVECSRAMRKSHKLGTKFRIWAKLTDREGGKPFLYSHYNWPYEVVE